jgi:GT2 family glycosyltransferase
MILSALHPVQENVRPKAQPDVVVIVVGFGNVADIVLCLRALARIRRGQRFDVFIAENGGPEAFSALRDALTGPDSPCGQLQDDSNFVTPPSAADCIAFSLPRAGASDETLVHVAQMPENLGYAGAINGWLRPLLDMPGWSAAWILNPDTEPTPWALSELADHAYRHDKGMVGSRIISAAGPASTYVCGLRWRKISARTVSIGTAALAAADQDPDNLDGLLDAPDGASIYVTRDLIERIGLMDERYFLYYEDLEWGFRAKALHELGYAHRSIVRHKGGTTIGSSSSRATRSPLAVYMEFRNRILFVRHQHDTWLTWALLIQLVHIATYLFAGSRTNMLAASRGVLAGLRGESGKPVKFLLALEASTAGSPRSGDLPKFEGRALALMISPRAAAH